MKVVAFAGYSGSGKTTLIEQVIRALAAGGLRVSTIKHAHQGFDIDQPGKDSWRHRAAGAREVLLVSDRRLALLREFDVAHEPDVHALVAELDARADWVVVEGFRHSGLPRVEVWRAAADGSPDRPVHYPHDAGIVAVATDEPARLPQPPMQPVLPLGDAARVAQWLLEHAGLFDYAVPRGASAPHTPQGATP
ncbi:molybdopterin-guanine dinucleotide biosynthesis protein B [Melaminivora alkalimesophila]|uniref:Molybdopterin guanine dinucleotide biosynthesis accessory protein MobB n=1 Tax=Melaminivora alkalimesophila TaxID=1165852 RepID=A0A317RAD0_9BURK|nr:molybdopterin-guanine dinucleotide biosynthesis protein B [Melaminivora alkalimesophila]PWW45926.1 molybdopterin guanine dinucleotide biosynthesis accessory protein MobB [Melaminivora alkalimesophila]